MKKKLWVFTFLILIMAALLCACGGSNTPTTGGKTDENPVEWVTLATPSTSDIYAKFLGGATTVISNFSRSSLKSNPRISAEGKLEVSINGNDFWLTVKLNYNNNDKSAAMLALELSTVEDSYDDNIIALYLYSERVYIRIGESKFSVNCKPEAWENYFPFEYVKSDMKQTAAAMASVLVNVQDKEPIAKQRKMGSNTETNYTVFIDLPATVGKLVGAAQSGSELLPFDVERYDSLIASLLGVSFDEIRDGKFPKSELVLDFKLYDMKLSEVTLDLAIDEIDNSETLFDNDNLDLKINLQSFYTYKTQNVAIPFVNNDFAGERAKYVYYMDNAFKITLDALKEVEAGKTKPYTVDITAKVFQEDRLDNYAFLEYKDATTKKVDRALYIYQNKAYFCDTVDSELKCTLSMPIDLTELANRTVDNDFNGESKLNVMDAVNYAVSQLRIDTTNIKFAYDEYFYEKLWYNMKDMLNFVDDKFEESIFEIDEIKNFVDFVMTKPSVIAFRYDTPFLSVVPDNDADLKRTIAFIKQSDPAIKLQEKAVESEEEDNNENNNNDEEQ